MLHWTIGDVGITRIVECIDAESGRWVLPQATPEALRPIDWLHPDYVDADGRLLLSIHALGIEVGGRRILVDTCLGNDKPRSIPDWNMRSGPFLEQLAQAGFARERVDTVICTHLHVDHVGWNTVLEEGRWVPTFPNARYLFAREEWTHWQDQPDSVGPVVADSVRPILDAGLADLVEMDHAVTDSVRLEPTPGHTPGHVAVRVRSRGEQAVITGDLLHHPCQLARPDWGAAVDHDAELADETRRSFLAACEREDVLLIGTHFSGRSAGRLRRNGAGYRLEV